MEHTREEIINALKIIKDTCKGRMRGMRTCDDCPLSINGDCVVQTQIPEEWNIKATPSVWKAFE